MENVGNDLAFEAYMLPRAWMGPAAPESRPRTTELAPSYGGPKRSRTVRTLEQADPTRGGAGVSTADLGATGGGLRYHPTMGPGMRPGRPGGALTTLAALVLLAVGTGGCVSGSMADRVTPEALHAAIDTGTAPVIVDVRTRREYDAGHVPDAIHVPFYTLLVRQDDVPGPPERPVVVYCEHGPRAGVARLALRLAGFTDVRYLDGHMSGWKRRGLPQELSQELSQEFR